MIISELIDIGSNTLKKHFIFSHQIDAELIASKVLNKSREKVIISSDQIVSKKEIINFTELVERRSKKEPIAYLFK